MLLELHVKNLALIEAADVELEDGLNILTGETGAGKSIMIGSVNLALGQKASREMIRNGAEYAYVELVFSVDPEKEEALRALDVVPDENGILIISRKIMASRSLSRINDETVTAARLKQVTSLLIDIHGQHEHQSLLHASKHLEILDTYAKSRAQQLKEQTAALYTEYTRLEKQLNQLVTDSESRRREADFLRFEIEEIENAQLKAKLAALEQNNKNRAAAVGSLTGGSWETCPRLTARWTRRRWAMPCTRSARWWSLTRN